MPIITEFSHPASEFVLGRTVSKYPSVTVEVERIVADTADRVTPFYWASGEEIEGFHETLTTDPTVNDVRVLDEDGDGRFYRAEWSTNVEPLVFALRDAEATILSAAATDGVWHVRILFPDHDSLSEFHDICATYDLDFELLRLYEAEGTSDPAAQRLTDEQREVLELALERGYFDVPREVTTDDLAEELGISTNAVSKRLRRGHETVLREAFEGVAGAQDREGI